MKRAKSNGHFDTCHCPGCVGDSGDSAPPPIDGGGVTPTPPLGKPFFWLPQIINQLSTSWGGTHEGTTRTWAGSTIFYSIATGPTSPNDFGGPESEGYNAAMMTAYKAGMAVLAFELWDDLIAVNLNQTTATSGNIITMAYSGTTTDGGTYADPVVSGTGAARTITAQRIWLSTGWGTLDGDSDIQFSKYGFTTYLHEIGHTLGLSHSGTYDASDDEPITYAEDAEYAQDTRQNTLMSYFGGWTDSSGNGDVAGDGVWTFIKDGDRAWAGADLYSATPMVDDIAAIQAKYGADFTTRAGGTTYGFGATAGRDVFDFDVNTHADLLDLGRRRHRHARCVGLCPEPAHQSRARRLLIDRRAHRQHRHRLQLHHRKRRRRLRQRHPVRQRRHEHAERRRRHGHPLRL